MGEVRDVGLLDDCVDFDGGCVWIVRDGIDSNKYSKLNSIPVFRFPTMELKKYFVVSEYLGNAWIILDIKSNQWNILYWLFSARAYTHHFGKG